MDPVAASENFLQQVRQKIVRTLFAGRKTEEEKQETTKECEPNLPPQDIGTTAEVGETSVDPPDEKAVSVQENHDDAPTTRPSGPDISERPHPGQTEHFILQERKTGICDSSQLTAADEEGTESCPGHDDKITQIAVASAEPLKSPENRELQGDVQSEQLHSDSLGLHNMPEDTTARDSAGPTGIEDKFMDKTQIQLQLQPKEPLQDMSGETLSEDKTTHINHQESGESVRSGQSPVADSSESSLAAEVETDSISLLTSCSEQPAGVKEALCIQENQEKQLMSDHADNEKFVTQTGQLEENDTNTVDLGDTDKTALESEASSAVKEITTSHDTTLEEVQPAPSLDAKTNESVVPAIPSYIQTETKEPDITMPVDASKADQERETEQTFLNKLINRPWSSFEALPSLSQKHDILRQLCGKLMGNRMLVLLGEAGSGKTTAAILLAQYAPVWLEESYSYLYYGDDEYIPETVADFPSKSLIIIDNFLGRYDPDSHSYWNAVVPLLESMKENAHKQILLLLTSRTSIFQNLLSSEETDMRFFLDENHVTTVTTDYRKMWKDICADVRVKTPDFEKLPSIGFPLCCQLAPHLAPDVQTILFQQPRLALHRTVKTLLDSNDIARTALTLLAVTDGSLDMNIFTSLARLQEYTCPEILDFLPRASSDNETPAQMVEFYRNCAFLIQVGNDVVSFRSEVIQEAVLVVLCDSHADVLAKYCSLKLLSQIALATSDNDYSDDAEKPALSDSATKVILRRFCQEMEDSDHFDVMLSPYFQHHLFVSMFESTVKEMGLLKRWTQKCSQSGLHFVFYAGAVPSVFRSALSELDKRNLWVVLQAVLACCYWGYNSDISDLMKVWKNKTDFKKALKEATIGDIVTGNLPGLSRREEPQWELIPLFPQDTLLVLSARRGNDAVVKTLAFRDMNVNSQGMEGRTALMHYCARGRRDMVEFLLGREADPMIQDEYDMTALMYALQKKQWDIPQKLLTTESCRAENTYLQSPLMLACSHEWSTQMITTLIDKGADLLQSDKWGYTCLHYACLQGHTDIVEYLLKEKKVDVQGKSVFGHTPFTLAVTGPGRSKLAKIFLNTEATKDADIIQVTKMICRASDCSVMETLLSTYHKMETVKNFALILGSIYGNTEMVQYLLRSGADAGGTYTAEAYTTLHNACIGFSVDCCEILLKKIDPNVESKIGSTPLMHALEAGALDCARLLLRRGAKLESSSTRGSCLHHATLSNLCSVLDWCIKEHKMDVNFINRSGMTPLQVACEVGKYHSVKYLLDNGADILKADDNEDTCLHHAARSGHWDIVRLLEKVDPSLMNVPNKKGETPAQLLKTTAPAAQSTSAE